MITQVEIKRYYKSDPDERLPAGSPDLEMVDLCQKCHIAYEGELYEEPNLLQPEDKCENCGVSDALTLDINYQQLKKLYNIVIDHNSCDPMVWDQDAEDIGEYLSDILIKEIDKRTI